MRKRMYGPRIAKENYDQYMKAILEREGIIKKRHDDLEKEIKKSEKKIEENNKSADEALDDFDALFN